MSFKVAQLCRRECGVNRGGRPSLPQYLREGDPDSASVHRCPLLGHEQPGRPLLGPAVAEVLLQPAGDEAPQGLGHLAPELYRTGLVAPAQPLRASYGLTRRGTTIAPPSFGGRSRRVEDTRPRPPVAKTPSSARGFSPRDRDTKCEAPDIVVREAEGIAGLRPYPR